jgi:hypothetical protein
MFKLVKYSGKVWHKSAFGAGIQNGQHADRAQSPPLGFLNRLSVVHQHEVCMEFKSQGNRKDGAECDRIR